MGGDLPFTPFDASAELSRVLLFDLPATALILFLLFRDRRPSVSGFPRPRLADCAVAAVAFASLVMIALVLLLASSLIHGTSMNPLVEAPRGLGEWSVMGLVCITTGYLEETYFRAYLFTRLEEAGLDEKWRVVVSVLLFSICHLYEGPWGVFNAAIAALILSLAYLRRKSAHGPAWAHAAYNALVYVNGT
jgi:membrane protease YdiL (CAAX protease family)